MSKNTCIVTAIILKFHSKTYFKQYLGTIDESQGQIHRAVQRGAHVADTGVPSLWDITCYTESPIIDHF